ncbi:DUF433 domain-containing protein [Acidipila sp. EB88]|uniref:DUF433 domain-containing protein n=1 Tax=Acidipila sp. EB88 TaxID=2305226 RepID=UPI000F5D80D8|nr:DUF433 domain-containing protein [Acidipila sp. EB88]RRA50485.1 DUF433 domain-containing protein [Acidipila sp. EB88]
MDIPKQEAATLVEARSLLHMQRSDKGWIMDWTACSSVEQVPGKMGGVPVLAGTRVQVDSVLENFASGETIEQIAYNFDLDPVVIGAVISFAVKWPSIPDDWVPPYLIRAVEVLPEFRLKVFFKNGGVRIADIRAMRGHIELFAEAFAHFDKVENCGYHVQWPAMMHGCPNTVEIEDEMLWREGEPIEQEG